MKDNYDFSQGEPLEDILRRIIREEIQPEAA